MAPRQGNDTLARRRRPLLLYVINQCGVFFHCDDAIDFTQRIQQRERCHAMNHHAQPACFGDGTEVFGLPLHVRTCRDRHLHSISANRLSILGIRHRLAGPPCVRRGNRDATAIDRFNHDTG